MGMTYSELNSLFETIITAMGLSYENGPKDQLNTVLTETDTKYPIGYSLPFKQVATKSSSSGPEWSVYRLWDIQVAFLDIDGTTKRTPDTNNEEKRSIISEQVENANIFLYNLYYANLEVLESVTVEKYEINALTMFQDMNGATGALLDFRLRTLSPLDCQKIVV